MRQSPPIDDAVIEPHSRARHDTDLTIRDLWRVARSKAWRVAAIVALSIVLAMVVTARMKPMYRARMLVAPVETGLSSDIEQNRIGRILGFSPIEERVTPFVLYLRMVETRALAEALNRDHDAMKLVFAGRWDAESGKWKPASGVLAWARHELHRLYGLPEAGDPTVNDLRDYLVANIQVEPRTGRGIHEITFYVADPVRGRNLLRWVHDTSETMVRERSRERTMQNIAYLQQQLAKTTITEERNEITGLLLKEDGTLMALQAWNPYAADLVEAPVVSDLPVRPSPSLMLLIGAVGGLVAAGLYVVGRTLSRAEPSRLSA